MPCMCGDPYCFSCGPAQGNVKCSVCGKWTMDGGCKSPKACRKVEDRLDQEEQRVLDASERDQREDIADSRYWK